MKVSGRLVVVSTGTFVAISTAIHLLAFATIVVSTPPKGPDNVPLIVDIQRVADPPITVVEEKPPEATATPAPPVRPTVDSDGAGGGMAPPRADTRNPLHRGVQPAAATHPQAADAPPSPKVTGDSDPGVTAERSGPSSPENHEGATADPGSPNGEGSSLGVGDKGTVGGRGIFIGGYLPSGAGVGVGSGGSGSGSGGLGSGSGLPYFGGEGGPPIPIPLPPPFPQPKSPATTAQPTPDACGASKPVGGATDKTSCDNGGKACTPPQKCRLGVCADEKQWVFAEIKTPGNVNQFSADLNGDGKKDNQFYVFMHEVYLKTNVDFANTIASMVDSGEMITLANFPSDLSQPVNFFQGVSMGNPDLFSGKGEFTIEKCAPPTIFTGGVRSKTTVDFNNPIPAVHAPVLTLWVRIPKFKTPFKIPFQCHQMIATIIEADGKIDGEIHGSIQRKDLEGGFGTALAGDFTEALQDPTSPLYNIAVAINISSAPCKRPDGSKSDPFDKTIDLCEITDNPLFAKALKPDLKVWDKAGFYDPKQPQTGDMDSLSFGIGFEARPAILK